MNKRAHIALIATAPIASLASSMSLAAAPSPAALWKQECSDCHLAYLPRLLPAATWVTLLNSLDRHFGIDATVDDKVRASLLQYARANAGAVRRGEPAANPSLRITTTNWFRREHREIAAATWTSPKVKSASNCVACHAAAAQGRFEDEEEREHGTR